MKRLMKQPVIFDGRNIYDPAADARARLHLLVDRPAMSAVARHRRRRLRRQPRRQGAGGGRLRRRRLRRSVGRPRRGGRPAGGGVSGSGRSRSSAATSSTPTRSERAIAAARPTAVMHFAARLLVGESVREPLGVLPRQRHRHADRARRDGRGWRRRGSCSRPRARRSASPSATPIDETHPQRPINPYGETKLAVERALPHLERAHRHPLDGAAVLQCRRRRSGRADRRGSRPGGAPDSAGDCRAQGGHAADRLRRRLPDAGRHLRARLRPRDRPGRRAPGGAAAAGVRRRVGAYNLGNGTGMSVRQVIDAVGRVAGRPVPHTIGPRRAGDPARLVASSARARADLGWQPRRDLSAIVRHGLAVARRASARVCCVVASELVVTMSLSSSTDRATLGPVTLSREPGTSPKP